MSKQFDIVIFGASGFTGQYVIEEMLRTSQNDSSIRWALAGRNASKLETSLDVASAYTGITLTRKIPVIICDITRPETLQEMAKQTKIVLNCVGPYRFFGEAMVKACIAESTHHLDISGEPEYLESMQLKHNEAAQKANIFVIGACGFDSLPAELGIMYASRNFEGELNEIECFMKLESPNGFSAHYGTWESAVHGFAHRNALAGIRRQLYQSKLPKPEFSQRARSPLAYSNEVKSRILPFPGSDRSVVYRSQRYLKEEEGRRPIQFMPYVESGSLFSSLLMVMCVVLFGLMALFKCGRYLLLKFPRVFSAGVFSHAGPSRKQISESSFRMTFLAKGWSVPSERHSSPPDEKMIIKMTAPEPGYISCSICLVQSAITILQEREKMPKEGGVLPAGAAFWHTDILNRVQSRGVSIQTITPIKQ